MFNYDFSSELDTSFYEMGWIVTRVSKDWSRKIGKMREDISEQELNEVDFLYNEIRNQVGRFITNDEKPDEAHFRMFGITVKKKVLHGKSERVNGADLLFEIQNEKFLLIQFKKTNKKGRFRFDKNQLIQLRSFCDVCDKAISIPPQCPSFIWLIDDLGSYNIHRILRLCDIERILNGRLSASKHEFLNYGIFRSTLKELFVRCWIGVKYPRKPPQTQLQEYVDSTDRIVVNFTIHSDY